MTHSSSPQTTTGGGKQPPRSNTAVGTVDATPRPSKEAIVAALHEMDRTDLIYVLREVNKLIKGTKSK